MGKVDVKKAVKLGPIVGAKRQRVWRVGIELEGGWTKLPAGTRLVHDGSVQFSGADQLSCRLGGVGELPSPILEVRSFPDWMRTYYPHKTNATCGMHVHLSFLRALTYARLMDEKFPATILAYVTQWAKDEKLDATHPIWSRLRGESEFCQHVFDADNQVRNTHKDHDRRRVGNRYSMINYCYGTHSTMECRLLPMMETVEQGIRAIQHIIDTTNAYLLTTAQREEKHSHTTKVDQEMLRDERKIYV